MFLNWSLWVSERAYRFETVGYMHTRSSGRYITVPTEHLTAFDHLRGSWWPSGGNIFNVSLSELIESPLQIAYGSAWSRVQVLWDRRTGLQNKLLKMQVCIYRSLLWSNCSQFHWPCVLYNSWSYCCLYVPSWERRYVLRFRSRHLSTCIWSLNKNTSLFVASHGNLSAFVMRSFSYKLVYARRFTHQKICLVLRNKLACYVWNYRVLQQRA